MTQNEENALRLEIEKLRRENDLMKQLGTRKGFFDHYFKLLPIAKTNEDAFHQVNNTYFDLFGKFMFTNNEAFRKSLKRYYQNQKK
jgi:hypothetical protein